MPSLTQLRLLGPILLIIIAFTVLFTYADHSFFIPEKHVCLFYLIAIGAMTQKNEFRFFSVPVIFSTPLFSKLGKLISSPGFIAVLTIVHFLIEYEKVDGFLGRFTQNAVGSDQWHYYNMLEKIKAWDLQPRDYNYGLGYPLLGVVGSWIWPRDPYLPVNLISMVLTVVFSYKTMLLISFPVSLAVATTLLLIFLPYFTPMTIFPWTSSITLACFAIALWIAFKPNRTWKDFAGFGFVSGWAFVTRYVDVFLFLPLGLSLILLERKIWLQKGLSLAQAGLKSFREASVGILIALLLACGVFYSHRVILGGYWNNPYQWHHHPGKTTTDGDPSYYLSQFGLSVIVHLHGQFVEARTWDSTYEEYKKDSLFLAAPVLIFGPAGLYLLAKNLRRRRDPRLWGVGLGLGLFLLIYGLHPGTSPGTQMMGSLHYFKAVSLLFCIGAAWYYWSLLNENENRSKLIQYGVLNLVLYLMTGLISYLMK